MSNYEIIRVIQKLNLDESDARTLADAIEARSTDNLATKADLAALRGEMQAGFMELRADIKWTHIFMRRATYAAAALFAAGVGIIGYLLQQLINLPH